MCAGYTSMYTYLQYAMHNYMQCICNCEHYGDHRVCMTLSDPLEDSISMRHGLATVAKKPKHAMCLSSNKEPRVSISA